MNKFIDWLIETLSYITKKNKLHIISFYNKTRFLINKNFTLNKIYKPIIKEKVTINKNLKQKLRDIENKNKEAEKTILNLQEKNVLLENKISIIQNLLTKRHD